MQQNNQSNAFIEWMRSETRLDSLQEAQKTRGRRSWITCTSCYQQTKTVSRAFDRYKQYLVYSLGSSTQFGAPQYLCTLSIFVTYRSSRVFQYPHASHKTNDRFAFERGKPGLARDYGRCGCSNLPTAF